MATYTGTEGNDRYVGTGAPDTAYGRGGSDTLRGGSGSDTLYGEDAGDWLYSAEDLDTGLEHDELSGGAGGDHLSIGFGDDADGGLGSDELILDLAGFTAGVALDLSAIASGSTFSIGGGTIQHVEKISRLIGTQTHDSIILGTSWIDAALEGGAGNDTLTALGGSGRLRGEEGNDLLRGSDQADLFDGGLDIDTADYRFAAGGVTVNLGSTLAQNTGGAGLDTLRFVENLLGSAFADKLSGNDLGNHLSGGDGADSLAGGKGADTLQGDAGADELTGGLGDDVYRLTDLLDTLVEEDAGGVDAAHLLTSGAYTLADRVENLTVLAVGAVTASGNSIANVITGNNYGGTLSGLGGDDKLTAGLTGTQLNGDIGNDTLQGNAGIDTMSGGAGNDTFHVGSGDVVTELAGEGYDLVYSAVAHTLAWGVEELVLLGNASISGTGNASANRITGNDGDHTLSGADGNDTLYGGEGYATLIGGNGDDLYAVNKPGDEVIETSASGGVDHVQSAFSYALSEYVEKLTLTGSNNSNATGNTLANTLIGNNGVNVLNGGYGADAMAGGLANDTYIVDDVNDQVIEAASGGIDSVQASVTYKLGAEVEKLSFTGSSNLNGYGNTLANTLVGNSGANVLNGGTGADSMTGGLGNDTYVVDHVADRTTETSTGGVDLVQALISHTLGLYVEKLTLLGSSNLNATGNTLANTLIGNSGINTIDGGFGADYMAGGSGNDTYVVDDAGDLVVEQAGGGVDTVRSSVTYRLGIEVERLSLTGSFDINGYGNTLANTLTGNIGANVLNGGLGADSMAGGLGNDTYVVDDVGDRVIETDGGGIDLVQALISYTLVDEVEQLTLLGSNNINATGNGWFNTLIGNSGINLLDGGLGVDTMAGGLGNDTYVVDYLGDQIVEEATGGVDAVRSWATYTLGANLEKLTLLGFDDIDGYGNTLANTMVGNSGTNTLNGGLGADVMAGGLGYDTYVVDNIGDQVIENFESGADEVQSSISYALGANVEDLRLLGSANLNATGNALGNMLYGNEGANVLNGGLDFDILTGGNGADTFVLSSLDNNDLSTDFSSPSDTLRISQAGIRVGDGDTLVEGAATVTGPGGFSATAEFVVVTQNIGADISTVTAAAAIGRATSTFAIGRSALFMVDDGSESALYYFQAEDTDAEVEASELTLILTLQNTASTVVSDVIFGA